MKSITKSSQDFGFVSILIALVVILGIAGAGWYVYQQNDDNKNETEKSVSSGKQEALEEKSDLPEGFTRYSNEELGLTFGYPKEWDKAELELGYENDHLVEGDEYEISFADNEDISAGLRSQDWKHDPLKGHGGLAYAPAYVSIDYAQYEDEFGMTRHSEGGGTVLFSEAYGAYECEGVATILVQKIDNNEDYSSVAFMYIDERKAAEDTADSMCENYESFISQEHIAELKDVSTTVKNI